jgi:ribonucleoside-diphosphate reductase alpha chain
MDTNTRTPTLFTRPDAVETWDALFRWRDGDRLRDTTVEETWQRVARAAAASAGNAAGCWAAKYAQAFRRWRVLPDERLLRSAGTQAEPIALAEPAVVLNAAAFVVAPAFSAPSFLRSQMVQAAALAVRFLDDALLQAPGGEECTTLRIGFIGVANAMEAMQAAPESADAARFADELGQALGEGCLRGSVDLAIERGPRARVDAELLRQWRRRDVPASLIERAELHGLRYAHLTAMPPHPSLARLANGVRDGIDWTPAAREHLRLAMQPYFDAPIPG